MKLSKKTIDEINRYTSPDNLLVAKKAGLYRLRVPIKVKCIIPVATLKEGMLLEVTAVRVTVSNGLVYLIHGKYYPYNCFVIINQ